MKARSRNHFVVYAIALSIAAHGIVAFVLHTMPAVSAAPEQAPTTVRIVHVATPPPPPPTPKPTMPPQHVSAVRPARRNARPVHVVTAPKIDTSGRAAGPSEPAVPANPAAALPGPGPVAVDTPSASPHPSCSQPFAAARVVTAVAPDVPDDDPQTATAQVQVTLDASGHVSDAHVYQSTDDMRLDRAAVAAARRSTYAAAIDNCLPIGGSYLFRVDFQQ